MTQENTPVTRPRGFAAVQVMLDHYGETFEPAPLPSGMQLQPMGECFMNAHRLAKGKYHYAEGVATAPDGWEYRHAWLVDASGRAIDPTWGESGTGYRGIIISREYRRQVMKCGRQGPEGGFLFWASNGPDPEAEIEAARISVASLS